VALSPLVTGACPISLLVFMSYVRKQGASYECCYCEGIQFLNTDIQTSRPIAYSDIFMMLYQSMSLCDVKCEVR
jgi:hypothetical protein